MSTLRYRFWRVDYSISSLCNPIAWLRRTSGTISAVRKNEVEGAV